MKTKYALITGAKGGIGRTLCSTFRHAGYKIIATDLNAEGSVDCDEFVQFDIMRICEDEDYWQKTVRSLREIFEGGVLAVLINNAAIQILNRTEDITMEELRKTFATNLFGPFLVAQTFLPDLQRAKGSVVNIASIHAFATKPGFVAYASSKAALVGLTRAMAVDLGPRVRVNAIVPAATATPMLLAGFKGKEKEYQELARMHPLERIATPEEVAHAAVFLASEQASFITGAAIHVDGGIGARLHDPV